MLVGRETEVTRIAVLLEEARRGRNETLVVVGDPGVGKTALLEEAGRLAADMRRLSATGVQSESVLPFATLHELMRPLLDLLPRLPASQARAVATALALAEGEADALAVSAGTLSLLVEAAASEPLLVVVDDAQWSDRASAEAIAFAARRLAGEEIAFLIAVRAGERTPFDSFRRLEVGPLEPGAAREVLRARAQPVPAPDVSALLAAAAGNPLVLLELPVELARELPVSATPHERLSRAFSDKVRELPEPSQLGLLLAAAEPDSRAVGRAAAALGLNAPLDPAEAAGLVRLDGGNIIFRHPVVRSLVYAEAPRSLRHVAHRALAEALSGDSDRDRAAWHLAAAAEGPDEVVAALLETTADRAGSRGGKAAEARALERAAHLSPAAADAARRLYAASRAAFWGGDSSRALELAESALPLAADPLLKVDVLVQIGAIGQWRGDDVSEENYLRALEMAGLDDERTAKLLYEVVKLRLDRLDAAAAVAVAPRLEAAAAGSDDFWRPRQLAGAAAAYLAAGEREHAIALFTELLSEPAIPAGFAYDFLALEWYDELRASLGETLREGRASGHLLRVAWNQSCTAHLELRLGRLGAAAGAAAEAIPVAEAIGTPALVGAASAALAGVHAWRGQAGACRELARVAIEIAHESRDRYQQGLAHQALAILALGEGRPDDAVLELESPAKAWRASTIVEPGAVAFVPDLVEALVLCGSADEARRHLDRYARIAFDAGRRSALAACARCEGVLAGQGTFDEPFRQSLELLEGSPLRLELARTRLAYGERLRRSGRRRDARRYLRDAHAAFAAEAAAPWQARAAAELRATGERVEDEASPLPEMTPQELHIALLVAEGKTNKEIATAMFLSPKTVGYHLSNVFRKLDIHSRAELARLVAHDAEEAQRSTAA